MNEEAKILKSDLFPNQLKEWTTKPAALWYSGDLSLLNLQMVSVVGSRDASPEGLARTRKLTQLLVSKGICVVSGLAEGVDAAAHLTALDFGGKTIAVMGTPIDECYPSTHLELKARIEREGLVLSQFQPNSVIQRSNFPRRNETMAALCAMTIVVEANIDSGTRHQVKSAISLGREVGFLASLTANRFPWVEAALNSGFGFSISTPKDLMFRLENIQARRPSAASQLALFPKPIPTELQSVDSQKPSEKEKASIPNSTVAAEEKRPIVILTIFHSVLNWISQRIKRRH